MELENALEYVITKVEEETGKSVHLEMNMYTFRKFLEHMEVPWDERFTSISGWTCMFQNTEVKINDEIRDKQIKVVPVTRRFFTVPIAERWNW